MFNVFGFFLISLEPFQCKRLITINPFGNKWWCIVETPSTRSYLVFVRSLSLTLDVAFV